MGLRLTVTEQVSRNAAFRGRALAIEVRGPKGFEVRAAEVIKHLPELLAAKGVEVKFYTPLGLELNAAALIGKTPADIDVMAAQIDALSQTAAFRKSQIELPEMLDISDELSIMKGEVTVGLFKQVMQGYEITGHNAYLLQGALDETSKTGNALTYVSLNDAREFAKRLSELTGRKFRVPTEPEWDAAVYAGKEMSGGKYWNWTETEMEPGSGIYFLRSLLRGARRRKEPPRYRYFHFAVRLVEDK